jgi:hypothetical protein
MTIVIEDADEIAAGAGAPADETLANASWMGALRQFGRAAAAKWFDA